jgi:hypothetical protein
LEKNVRKTAVYLTSEEAEKCQKNGGLSDNEKAEKCQKNGGLSDKRGGTEMSEIRRFI